MQRDPSANSTPERDFNEGARPAANDAARRPETQAMAAELERQRRLYEGLLDSTPDLAYVWDLEHRFVYANRGLLAMWGRTWDEAIGKTCLELGYEPWHAEMHSREIDQVVATRAPVRGVVPFTGTFGRRLYDYLLVPVLGPDGEVEAVAGTTRDVTELKATEEALRESDRRKDEFIATLAHELRNPLAPLRNCLSILGMDDAGQVDRHKLHEVMERQVAQLVHLVDDLLDISRITSGKIVLRREPVWLGRIVERALEMSRPAIDASGHRLDVAVDDPDLVLVADPMRLAQVVCNLLHNAAKYTDAGGRIQLEAVREGDQAVLRVRDNGPGIAEEDLDRVFEPFAQCRSTVERGLGGLGIGLTLVRRVVELHGGTVRARSDGPAKGTEFVVRLPLGDGNRDADHGLHA